MKNILLLIFLALCFYSANAQKKSSHADDLPGVWEMTSLHQKKITSNSGPSRLSKYLVFGSGEQYYSYSSEYPDTSLAEKIVEKNFPNFKDTVLIAQCYGSQFPFNYWTLKTKKLSLNFLANSGMTTNPQVPLKTYYNIETISGKIISLNKTQLVVKFDGDVYTYKRVAREPGGKKIGFIKPFIK